MSCQKCGDWCRARETVDEAELLHRCELDITLDQLPEIQQQAVNDYQLIRQMFGC